MVIRTKKIGSYFQGRIIQFNGEWSVVCDSYAGGDDGILDVLDFKYKKRSELCKRLREFCSKKKLILNFRATKW